MVSNEASDGAGAGSGVHVDFLLTESPHVPTLGYSYITQGRLGMACPRQTMPIITISLDNEPSLPEHKVGLKPPEHCLVHLKLQTPLPELGIEDTFNVCHFLRESLPQASLAVLFACLRRTFTSESGLTHPLPCFRGMFIAKGKFVLRVTTKRCTTYLFACLWRMMTTKPGLPYLLSELRGTFTAKSIFIAKESLCSLRSMLWRLFSSFRATHPMFNYNTNHSWRR